MPFRIPKEHENFSSVGDNPTEENLDTYIERLWKEHELAKAVKTNLYGSASKRKKKQPVDDKPELG